ncbi:hypothetical protein [Accumulibacter sp.]|uniref:hypothetical protein n=1 Tax=Accumulibacter sp. TaxID=2053492 RepID=UPI0026103CE1|nr:hypothetical protein [Accumulibacter sp.]
MFTHFERLKFLSATTTRCFVLALALIGAATRAGGQVKDATAEEMALLPSYCTYVQGTGKYETPEAKRWAARMGPGFSAMHHYCWGLMNWQRAMRGNMPAKNRDFLLGTVRQDYLYVVKTTSSNFIMLPEIHTRIGQVELRLSLYHDAEKSFARARALRPDYWPAYSYWADFLITAGKKAEAKQLVKAGLEYSPGSRMLRDQYRLLGGNFSEIVQKTAPARAGAESGIADPALEATAPDANENSAATEAPDEALIGDID